MTHVKDNTPTSLLLSALNERLTVCRLDARAKIPAWAVERRFFSVTRTSEELSIICPERQVPSGVACEKGWRAIKVEGPFEFSVTGVISSLTAPLARAGIPVFVVSTFETDYLLVKEERIKEAAAELASSGHMVEGEVG